MKKEIEVLKCENSSSNQIWTTQLPYRTTDIGTTLGAGDKEHGWDVT